MKSTPRCLLCLAAVVAVMAALSGVVVHAQGAAGVSLSVTVTGPQPDGTYHVEGTVTVSGSCIDEPLCSNTVDVRAEFMTPGGQWPVFYDSYSLADQCNVSGGACLTPEEVRGVGIKGVQVYHGGVGVGDQGKSFAFAADVPPPADAVEMRIVAQFSAVLNGNPWPAFFYAWDVHGPQGVTILPTAAPTVATPSPTPTPLVVSTATPTPTPTPASCQVTLSPSPAYVMPGGEVSITGAAVAADGQPMANAGIDINLGGLDGSMYVVQARTDAQGRFSYLYAAPTDVGGVRCVNLTVRVEGCPVSANSTICFGPPPTATETPAATASPTPLSSVTATPTPIAVPPTATPTPTRAKEGDLRIDRIEVFQPIEGSDLAAHRRTAVRVFVRWTGKSIVQTKVALYVNGQLFPQSGPFPVQPQYSDAEVRAAHDSVNFFLPADLVQPGQIEIRAVVDPDDAISEVDETNNERVNPPVPVYRSRGLSIMVVMLDGNVQPGTVDAWAVQARRFLLQTYPVPAVRVVRPYARLHAHRNILLGYLDALRVDMLRKLHNYAHARVPANQAEFGVGLFSGTPYGSWLGMVKRGLSYVTYRNAPLVGQDFPLSLAHEIGHKYNGGVEEASSSRDGLPIPEGFRYDWLADQLAYVDGSPDWINFMGDPHATGIQAWVNANTYNQILRGRTSAQVDPSRALAAAFPVGSSASLRSWQAFVPFDQVLLLAGGFDEQGDVVLLPPLAWDASEVAPSPGGPYTAELQAADGTVLATASFDVDTSAGEYDTPNPGMFSFELPYPADVARLVFFSGDRVIHVLDRSPAAPALAVEQPVGGGVGGETTVSWTASDSDGDALSYTVLYSPDGGETWLPLTVDWPDPSLPIDGAQLPGGDNALIRVLASDGLNVVAADSAPFSVPKHAPTVEILPADPGAEPWTVGRPNTLAAVGDDVEDGWLPDSAYRWTSDRDGLLGQGSVLRVALSAGTHVVTVLVGDADGQQASDSVTVVVEGAAPLGGLLSAEVALYAIGGGIALVLLLGLVAGIGLVRRRRTDSVLRVLADQAALVRRQIRSGMLHPSQVQPLQARDARGWHWSLDPLRGNWSVWDGAAWRPRRRPVGGSLWPKVLWAIVIGVILAVVLLVLAWTGLLPGIPLG